MTKQFRFEPEQHRYFLGDEEMPSLTKILSPLNDFSNVNSAVLAAKAQAGTDIHLTIKLWITGTLDESSLAEGNKIALDLFKKWNRDERGNYGSLVECEVPIFNEKLKYGCTPDIVFQEAIVEIKTRPYKKHIDPVQLIAQAKCFPEFPPKSLWVLSLDIVERKYDFKRAEDKQAWGMFRKLLDKHNSDREFATLIKNWKEK